MIVAQNLPALQIFFYLPINIYALFQYHIRRCLVIETLCSTIYVPQKKLINRSNLFDNISGCYRFTWDYQKRMAEASDCGIGYIGMPIWHTGSFWHSKPSKIERRKSGIFLADFFQSGYQTPAMIAWIRLPYSCFRLSRYFLLTWPFQVFTW